MTYDVYTFRGAIPAIIRVHCTGGSRKAAEQQICDGLAAGEFPFMKPDPQLTTPRGLVLESINGYKPGAEWDGADRCALHGVDLEQVEELRTGVYIGRDTAGPAGRNGGRCLCVFRDENKGFRGDVMPWTTRAGKPVFRVNLMADDGARVTSYRKTEAAARKLIIRLAVEMLPERAAKRVRVKQEPPPAMDGRESAALRKMRELVQAFPQAFKDDDEGHIDGSDAVEFLVDFVRECAALLDGREPPRAPHSYSLAEIRSGTGWPKGVRFVAVLDGREQGEPGGLPS